MTVATTLIPGLDEIVRNGDPKRRAEAARRIAELFFQDAAHLRPNHVDLFDEILIDLVPHAELIARAELAERLSLVCECAAGAGRAARARERDPGGGADPAPLAGARRRGPARDRAGEGAEPSAGDVGAAEAVARSHRRHRASAATARWSAAPPAMPARSSPRAAIRELIKRANQDGVLTLTVGQRADLSDTRLKQLLAGSIDAVRRRLFDVVRPERQNAIKLAVAEITGVPERFEKQARFRAGPAHRPGAARGRQSQRGGAARLCQDPIAMRKRSPRSRRCPGVKIQIPRQPDFERSLRSDPDRRQDHRPRMGDRARPDPAAARPEPGAGAVGYRERAGEFRQADALDRRARGRLLEDARRRDRVQARRPAARNRGLPPAIGRALGRRASQLPDMQGDDRMLAESAIQSHAERIRNDGYTVIEGAASSDLVEGLKRAVEAHRARASSRAGQDLVRRFQDAARQQSPHL